MGISACWAPWSFSEWCTLCRCQLEAWLQCSTKTFNLLIFLADGLTMTSDAWSHVHVKALESFSKQTVRHFQGQFQMGGPPKQRPTSENRWPLLKWLTTRTNLWPLGVVVNQGYKKTSTWRSTFHRSENVYSKFMNMIKSSFLHLKWREGKNVARCNSTGPSPLTRGSSRGKRKHIRHFRTGALGIQRLYGDNMNLTIINEVRNYSRN